MGSGDPGFSAGVEEQVVTVAVVSHGECCEVAFDGEKKFRSGGRGAEIRAVGAMQAVEAESLDMLRDGEARGERRQNHQRLAVVSSVCVCVCVLLMGTLLS